MALESRDPGFAAPPGTIHLIFKLMFLSHSLPDPGVPHPIAGMFHSPLALQSFLAQPAFACMGSSWLWVKYSYFPERS